RDRLSPFRGSQAWPTATSTMARYLALSKNASRRLAAGAAGRRASRPPLPGAGAPGAPDDGDGAGGRGVPRWLPFGRGEAVTDPPSGNSGSGAGRSLRVRGRRQHETSEAPKRCPRVFVNRPSSLPVFTPGTPDSVMPTAWRACRSTHPQRAAPVRVLCTPCACLVAFHPERTLLRRGSLPQQNVRLSPFPDLAAGESERP